MEEENYFTLSNPSLNNKPQSTTASILQPKTKSSLLDRRQRNSTIPIQCLELPSTESMGTMIQPFNPITAGEVVSLDPVNTIYNTSYSLIQPMISNRQRQRQLSNSSHSSTDKQYSFVTIPGTNQKKRPRRRYDEIERLYHCNWLNCTKAYGTLNHLNAHVSMQKHGPKRHPSEFREMRKEWRKQKKEREAQKKRQEDVTTQFQTFQLSSDPNSITLNGFY